MRQFLKHGLFVVLLISAGGPHVAHGNGDEFFRDNAFSYSGSVRDESGNYIEDATITVAITVQTPRGERQISYNAYTNNIGRYRTLDVASVVLVMEEIELEVDPDVVELSVEKSGYRVTRRLDRSRALQLNCVFEVDFWMTQSGDGLQ
jgi:hypothetical protein